MTQITQIHTMKDFCVNLRDLRVDYSSIES
jgi:hypothetical protein